jgi:hypothetical protein
VADQRVAPILTARGSAASAVAGGIVTVPEARRASRLSLLLERQNVLAVVEAQLAGVTRL